MVSKGSTSDFVRGKPCSLRPTNYMSLSILAWRFLWAEEPGRLRFTGSQRVGRDGSYLAHMHLFLLTGFPGGSVVKKPRASAENVGSVPGLGRSPGEGNGSPLQYCCLENSMDRGAWQAAVHGVAKSQTRMSDFTFTFFHFLRRYTNSQ